MDVTWDDDTVPRLDFDDPGFDRVTAIPELPSELLAKQMMMDSHHPGEGDPVSGLFDKGGPKAPDLPAPGAHSPVPFELEGALHAPPPGTATGTQGLSPGRDTREPPAAGQSTAPPPRRQREEPSLELDERALDSARGQRRPPQRATATSEGPASLELDLTGFDGGAPPPVSDPGLRAIVDRYATGDFSGALVLAEALLEGDPDHAEALRYANKCRDVLMQMYAARLGPLDQVVTMSIPSEQIRWLSLDHRSGFLLSLVDGVCSLEELLDISGMPRLDALRIMYGLFQERVITLSPR
ncbi:MAG TPA: hypothetical protein VG937_28665 [Polyangiaceae bacterium]|nr:hypothetical protein [Polyangiaceae bacterium]